MDKKCVKCEAVLIQCAVSTPMGIGGFSALKKPSKPAILSDIRPYVCPKCGYTEWYVDKPESFS